jgi:hypothetical protein
MRLIGPPVTDQAPSGPRQSPRLTGAALFWVLPLPHLSKRSSRAASEAPVQNTLSAPNAADFPMQAVDCIRTLRVSQLGELQ